MSTTFTVGKLRFVRHATRYPSPMWYFALDLGQPTGLPRAYSTIGPGSGSASLPKYRSRRREAPPGPRFAGCCGNWRRSCATGRTCRRRCGRPLETRWRSCGRTGPSQQI